MTTSNKYASGSIILPAVRKDFWEFLISRHPIEEEYAPSTKHPYRWRSVPELRLVVAQFVSQHGVGVFVRGERRANPNEVEQRLHSYAARLKKAVGVDEFFIVGRGTSPSRYFFQKFKLFNSSTRKNWGRMADWLHSEADAYEVALRRVMADGTVSLNATRITL
jgi:hypothetical protein